MAPKRKRAATTTTTAAAAHDSQPTSSQGTSSSSQPAAPDQRPQEQQAAARRPTRQTPVHPPPVPGVPVAIRSAGGAAAATGPPPPVLTESQVSPPKTAATHARSRSQPTVSTTHPASFVPPPPVIRQTPVPIPKIPTSPGQTTTVQAKKRGRGRPPGSVKAAPPSLLQPPQQPQEHLQQPQPYSSAPMPPSSATQSVLVAQQGSLRWAPPETTAGASAGAARTKATSGSAAKENIRPSDLVAPEITYHVPQAHSSPASGRPSLVRPHGPSAQPPRLGKAPPVVTPVHPPKPPTRPVPERPPPRADRNIDKVVLGKLCFRTWYPSYYGKEVLGDVSGNAKGGGSKEGSQDAGGKTSKKDRDQQNMLERLYVCPCCFKYSKELVAWWGHVRLCEKKCHVPGRKVYVHPRGRRKILVPQDVKRGPAPKKRRGESGIRYVEETVQDEGEWSIWEVDGETDGLFCQNLSLFAKLFLDNKSVFFDVTGFNYFLLVYTPPPSVILSGTAAGNAAPTMTQPAPQVTGFFSKEKMSWDNNNLACILVFPPWQRKGLGALLMGASYEISRREGVLGGPEKPISDLGKKGYKRFWGGEIARWLLSLGTGAPGSGQGGGEVDELIVDVNDCSRATWMLAEDCLSTLRDMGVATDGGLGPGKPVQSISTAMDESTDQANDTEQARAEGGDEEEDAKQAPPPPQQQQVPRVQVDKDAVRRYLATQRINLERPCDPAGFVEGYAMKREEEGGSEGGDVVMDV